MLINNRIIYKPAAVIDTVEKFSGPLTCSALLLYAIVIDALLGTRPPRIKTIGPGLS